MARHEFSDKLVTALARIEPGQGLFFTRVPMGNGQFVRIYVPANAGESRKPSADYKSRYSALFKVLQG